MWFKSYDAETGGDAALYNVELSDSGVIVKTDDTPLLGIMDLYFKY